MDLKFEITKENLAGKTLFVSIPMYGSMCTGYCMHSCLELQNLCNQLDVHLGFSFQLGESLIPRARNYCVHEFMKTDFTHMLFVDADIQFDPRDVLVMMLVDRDVIGAPYPKKFLNWNSIKDAVVNNPDIDVNDLSSLGSSFVFNVAGGVNEINITEPVEVLEVGTGFMLVKREVFTKLDEKYPELKYTPDHPNFAEGEKVSAYFDCGIDKETNRYLSEDYYFNKLWRDIGGKVWYCPWIKTVHYGTFGFCGDIPTISKNLGKL